MKQAVSLRLRTVFACFIKGRKKKAHGCNPHARKPFPSDLGKYNCLLNFGSKIYLSMITDLQYLHPFIITTVTTFQEHSWNFYYKELWSNQ